MRYLILLTLIFSAPAEIIDRVAVSLERQVITESEIYRELRVAAFLNGETPNLTPEAKREMADKLVEQQLIRREIETSRYATAPADGMLGYTQFRKLRYPDEPAYAKALAQAGLEDADIRQAFQWQRTLLDFIDVRFRPGIQIPEAEIRDYYDNELTAEAKTKNQPLPPFDEARASIEAILLSRRVDNAVDRWLGQVRTQIRIRYREEVFGKGVPEK